MGRLSRVRERLTRSTYWPVWLGRASWRAKGFARLWWAGVVAPLRDPQQWTGPVAAGLTVYAGFSAGVPQRMVAMLDSMPAWQGALISALSVWVTVNFVFAYFKRRQQEKAAGVWIGANFVYNEPLLLGAVTWIPADNGTWKQINVRGPEANSFVMLHIEHYPATDRIRAQVVHVWNEMMVRPANGIQTQSIGTRVNNGRLWVVAESLPGTVPVVLRVYCHSFELGKGPPAEVDPYIPH